MKIKEIRQLSGLKQAEFAKKYKIPLQTLRQWEQGVSTCKEYISDLLEYKVRDDMTEECIIIGGRKYQMHKGTGTFKQWLDINEIKYVENIVSFSSDQEMDMATALYKYYSQKAGTIVYTAAVEFTADCEVEFVAFESCKAIDYDTAEEIKRTCRYRRVEEEFEKYPEPSLKSGLKYKIDEQINSFYKEFKGFNSCSTEKYIHAIELVRKFIDIDDGIRMERYVFKKLKSFPEGVYGEVIRFFTTEEEDEAGTGKEFYLIGNTLENMRINIRGEGWWDLKKTKLYEVFKKALQSSKR